jgi:hypothetical protein
MPLSETTPYSDFLSCLRRYIKPVEKVLLEKEMRGVSVDYLLLTLYEMASPVAASILQFRWQAASSRPIIDLTP